MILKIDDEKNIHVAPLLIYLKEYLRDMINKQSSVKLFCSFIYLAALIIVIKKTNLY